MSKKMESLLEAFQGNAYPAMLEDLGQHLGVSADSIRRLAPGWAPIVEFKKGKNFMGWWAIPERNAEGDVVGLSLRSQNDMKVMLPGSKHGLVYEVNPDHEQSGGGYSAGPENWIRTMDAGRMCPVCGKPDGCLLSSEDVSSPKAVVCIRTKEGAEKPLKFGFLHILKPEGKLGKNVSTLAGDPAEYVLIVEGFSDTAAALDLGFGAVGRPSNLACMDMLADLVRGRRVMVIGENDKKADGKEPGREGMVAAFQVVRKVCRDARMVMPPEHIKDLRAWVVKYGLTHDQLLAYAEQNGQEHAAEIVLPDNRPLTISRAYLDDQHRMAGRYLVKRWAGAWYRYTDGKYKEIPLEAFESPLFIWSHDKYVQTINASTGAQNMVPLKCDNGLIQNITKAIIADTLVPGTEIPCWVNGAKMTHEPHDLIVFANGILHAPSFVAGASEKDYLLPPTPDLFTTAALPFAFDGQATCPVWEDFLGQSLGDDPEKITLLQEWFGYCMTPDTRQQKMMYFRGPSGAGKGTVLRALGRLVGAEQSSSTDFTQIVGPFGMQHMLGKLICVIPDARTTKGGDMIRGLELLLNITGRDEVTINRKFKDPLAQHRLTARITIASNEFIDVQDHATAMVRRLNIIEFTESFVDREDFDLDDKLSAENPGIAVWALEGLRRLREQKRFTIPPSMKDALKEWRTSTSPMASFIEECCDLDPAVEVQKSELYDAWMGWSRERKITQLSMSRFMERIRSNAPTASSMTYEKGAHKFSVYRGLSLKRWAQKQYLGKPV